MKLLVLTYASRMLFSFTDDARAGQILEAVRVCEGLEDRRHPIRAVQLPIEVAASCECTDQTASRAPRPERDKGEEGERRVQPAPDGNPPDLPFASRRRIVP